MSFKGKVVVVTGASSGIGAATAIAFAAEGASVVLVGRNLTKLNNVAAKCKEHGNKSHIITGDVCQSEDNKRMIDDTIKLFGKLDILVNNAGIYFPCSILAPNAMEQHEKMMNTNLQSAVHLTHLAAPHLIATKGNIVNVSSIAAKGVAVEDSFSYLASKAALDHFTRAIALELAAKGVRANTVNPGAVRTDIMENFGITAEKRDAFLEYASKQIPLKKAAEPEEIADLILFLASDRAKSITGSSIVSDNGALLQGLAKSQ